MVIDFKKVAMYISLFGGAMVVAIPLTIGFMERVDGWIVTEAEAGQDREADEKARLRKEIEWRTWQIDTEKRIIDPNDADDMDRVEYLRRQLRRAQGRLMYLECLEGHTKDECKNES